MNCDHAMLIPQTREIYERYASAGLLFHDIKHPAFLIQGRAALGACLAITERQTDMSPGEFLFEAITKLTEDMHRRKFITDEELDQAIQPLLITPV